MNKKAVGLLIGSGVVVLLCLLALLGTAVGSPGGPLTVNSTTDVKDGDTSSIANLMANPGPDGVISLREAIEAANNTPGSNLIAFNIPSTDPGYEVSSITGTWTISLTTALPTLSGGGTVISGTTQAAFIGGDPNPYGLEIEIDGTNAGSNARGFWTNSADNVIKGLVINRFAQAGILVDTLGSTGNRVIGNYIGTDATGALDLGNYLGVYIRSGAQDNVIGGDTPGERNIISGNERHGVYISGSGTNGNTVSGNYIGTDASGSLAMPNHTGVAITVSAQNNTIGGDTPGERNVISGNDYYGLFILDSGTNGNAVSGNYIGTDATGSSDLGNGFDGVYIGTGAQDNVIGGDSPGERNVISGNDKYGVKIKLSGTISNTISGNYIGTDATGSSDLGNTRDGVVIMDGAQNNVIGGDTPGERNIIAFNGLRGVEVVGATTTSNTITQNSIHSNVGLGINLLSGGNTELSPPTISNASCNSISGTAPANATVELFTGPDDEGKTYLTTVSAGGSGDWSASDSFAVDTYLTATATDAGGNTSEFSAAVDRGCYYYIYLPLIMKNY